MIWNKYTRYFLIDEPVPFYSSTIPDKEKTENNCIKIYPINMKKYIDFHILARCLLLEKDTSAIQKDIEKIKKIISMSYLEYLYFRNSTETPHISYLTELLRLCCKTDLEIKFGYTKEERAVLKIGEIVYNNDDFDEIRKIITEQNMLEIPDELIQKEIRDKMKEAEALRSKINNNKMASLEEQIACIIVSTGLNLDNIYELPIRKFAMILQRADMKLHYNIYLSASMSGMVEFKDKSFIRHWMSEVIKDKFGGNAVEYDKVKSKVDMSDLKK